MGRGDGSRTGHSRYRAQRERMLRKARRDNEPCCFCGAEIDYDLRYPHPHSPSADHELPTSKGGRNFGPDVVLRPCHLRCNTAAGNRWAPGAYKVDVEAESTVWYFESGSVKGGGPGGAPTG